MKNQVSKRHLLSILDFESNDLLKLVERAVAFATTEEIRQSSLRGRTVGIYFRGPSTRTRTSFTVAAHRLGANTIHYGPADLQLSTGETVEDTARVLSGFLHALVIRTNDSLSEMQHFAMQDRMSV